MFVVVIALFTGIGRSKAKKVDIYLSGINIDDDTRTFRNSLSGETQAIVRNWYMESLFGESKIAPIGVIFNSVIMVAALVLALCGLTLI